MLRQSDINQAFREAILRNSKGYQYLHTRLHLLFDAAGHSFLRVRSQSLD
jgi:hypothetical protein